MPKIEARNKKEAPTPQGPHVAEKLMEPGDYEVTDSHTFEVKINLLKKDGRWQVVKGGEGVDSHTCVFRLWKYDEMVGLKKQATSYDTTRRIHTVDQDVLNRLKIQKLLVSWTFGDHNPRLKIHRVQGVLTDESWDNFKRLQTNIIDYIFRGMNEVLDFNG